MRRRLVGDELFLLGEHRSARRALESGAGALPRFRQLVLVLFELQIGLEALAAYRTSNAHRMTSSRGRPTRSIPTIRADRNLHRAPEAAARDGIRSP
jgi:hypothetical protein